MKAIGREIIIAVAFGLALPVGTAHSDDRGPIDQDIHVSLGAFLVTSDSKLRVDADGSTGTDLHWENEFGLKDKDQFRLDASWRFAKRHKVRVMWFENNRGASRTLTRDITFQGVTYPINVTVGASLDEQIVELAYEYAFYQTEKLELAGSAGIHNTKLVATLSGSISTTGGVGGSAQASTDASLNGPFPVFGFRLLWNMGNHFYLDGLAELFYISFDNFDGHISDYRAAVTWMPWHNVGIGLGYDKFVTRVDVSKADLDGSLRFGYSGIVAFMTVGFR
jgi:hypothetical protein